LQERYVVAKKHKEEEEALRAIKEEEEARFGCVWICNKGVCHVDAMTNTS
jgi:hypothetical protein